MKKYALETADHTGVYYTGHIDKYGTPEVINNIEKAAIYDSVGGAMAARAMMKNPLHTEFVIRELDVTIKLGYIVKEQ